MSGAGIREGWRMFRSSYQECAHCGKKKHCPTLFFERMGLHACLDCACDAMEGKW